MDLWQLPDHIPVILEESLEDRFMGSEALYVRFLKKFAAAGGFNELCECIKAQDYKEAERRAHNLKGVSANLGLSALEKGFARIVTQLRSGSVRQKELETSMKVLRPEWDKTLRWIGEID